MTLSVCFAGLEATSEDPQKPFLKIRTGVDKLTNTKPPPGLTGFGGGSAIYDNRGRFYYTGIVAKF